MRDLNTKGLQAAFEAFEATGISADHFGITAAIRAYLAAALTPLKGAPDAREADPITELAAASRAADKDWEERSGIRYPGGFPSTLPATKGVTEATLADAKKMARQLHGRSSGDPATNLRTYTARMAEDDAKAAWLLNALASLSLPAPGEGEAAEIARLKHECKCLAEAIANAAKRADIYNGQIPLTGPHLLLLADDLATVALSPTAPDLGAVKALEAARAYIKRGYVNGAGAAVLEQIDAALSTPQGEKP